MFSYALCWQCHLSASALCCFHVSVWKEREKKKKNKSDIQERGAEKKVLVFFSLVPIVLSLHSVAIYSSSDL